MRTTYRYLLCVKVYLSTYNRVRKFLIVLKMCGCATIYPVTSWMVPPQKRSPRTVHTRIIGPPGPNIESIPRPTLSIVFSKSVEPEKWTRKDEAVSGWVSRRAKHGHLVHPCMFEAMDSMQWQWHSALHYLRSIPRQVVE